MLLRSLKVHPSLLLALTILGFFAWQISKGPGYEIAIPNQIIPSAGGLSSGLGIGGPKTPRIAMITFVTEQRSYIHTVLKNKSYYARRHGYDFIMDYEAHADRGAMFWKFEMVYRMVKTGKYDWIWWQDFDTLITNTETKVTDIIQEELGNVTNPERIDFLLTHDCNGLNAGSFIVRAHERSTKFFRKVEALHDEARSKDKQISEQDAMVQLLAEDSAIAESAHVVPQWKLNSFPDEIACYSEPKKPWVQGMFFLHFAGAWAHVKGDDPTGQLMDKYGGQILWGDWKDAFETSA